MKSKTFLVILPAIFGVYLIPSGKSYADNLICNQKQLEDALSNYTTILAKTDVNSKLPQNLKDAMVKLEKCGINPPSDVINPGKVTNE